MGIFIRQARETDLSFVHEIELLSYTEPWSREVLQSELIPHNHNVTLVAEHAESGRVVGHCFFWLVLGDEIHLNNIAVHPDWRRQGIARLLLHECIKYGKINNIPSIVLEVRENNLIAREFYAQEGFEKVGRRRKYYTSPAEDALILRLKIRPSSR